MGNLFIYRYGETEQSTPPLPSFSKMFVPIDQRKWKDIAALDYVDKGSLSLSVSKTMTQILRHRGLHRETSAAMDWDTLLLTSCRDHRNALTSTNHEWSDHLHRGSDKKRFQFAGTLTASFSTCVLSMVTLEETKLIHHWWIT